MGERQRSGERLGLPRPVTIRTSFGSDVYLDFTTAPAAGASLLPSFRWTQSNAHVQSAEP